MGVQYNDMMDTDRSPQKEQHPNIPELTMTGHQNPFEDSMEDVIASAVGPDAITEAVELHHMAPHSNENPFADDQQSPSATAGKASRPTENLQEIALVFSNDDLHYATRRPDLDEDGERGRHHRQLLRTHRVDVRAPLYGVEGFNPFISQYIDSRRVRAEVDAIFAPNFRPGNPQLEMECQLDLRDRRRYPLPEYYSRMPMRYGVRSRKKISRTWRVFFILGALGIPMIIIAGVSKYIWSPDESVAPEPSASVSTTPVRIPVRPSTRHPKHSPAVTVEYASTITAQAEPSITTTAENAIGLSKAPLYPNTFLPP